MTNWIEAQCRTRGIRLTGQRRLIAQILSEASDHPDVNELHRRVSACDARVALATGYRPLKRLEEVGMVERHAFRDGRARYERGSKAHHDHLIDVDTGKVIEFTSTEIERLQTQIAESFGFEIVGHRLELYVRRKERG